MVIEWRSRERARSDQPLDDSFPARLCFPTELRQPEATWWPRWTTIPRACTSYPSGTCFMRAVTSWPGISASAEPPFECESGDFVPLLGRGVPDSDAAELGYLAAVRVDSRHDLGDDEVRPTTARPWRDASSRGIVALSGQQKSAGFKHEQGERARGCAGNEGWREKNGAGNANS
jgi:hypothetical protein